MVTRRSATPARIEFYGGYEVYSDTGVDLTQLRRNLTQPVEERWQAARQGGAWLTAFRPTGDVATSRGNLPAMFDPAAMVRQLLDQQVEFVVIGGLAMAAHGSSYITNDLDVCYRRTPGNLAAVERAFTALHPYLRGAPPGLPFRFDPPTIQAGLNFTLTPDLGDVDLIGEVTGVGNYDQVLARSVPVTAFGLTFRVLSLDGLIAAKKAADRAKDQAHLLELEELKKLRDAPGGNAP